jgi:hypothetical protein
MASDGPRRRELPPAVRAEVDALRRRYERGELDEGRLDPSELPDPPVARLGASLDCMFVLTVLGLLAYFIFWVQ